MAQIGGTGLLQLPRNTGKHEKPLHISFPGDATVATNFNSSRSKTSPQLDAIKAARGVVAPETACSPPLAKRSLGRHSSKIRASCGNAARGDLCGGYRATGIPTATQGTVSFRPLGFPRLCRGVLSGQFTLRNQDVYPLHECGCTKPKKRVLVGSMSIQTDPDLVQVGPREIVKHLLCEHEFLRQREVFRLFPCIQKMGEGTGLLRRQCFPHSPQLSAYPP